MYYVYNKRDNGRIITTSADCLSYASCEHSGFLPSNSSGGQVSRIFETSAKRSSKKVYTINNYSKNIGKK